MVQLFAHWKSSTKMVQKAKTKVDSETKKIANRELKDIEELVLPSSKLKFCSEQLQNLNYMFTKKLSAEPDLEYSEYIFSIPTSSQIKIFKCFETFWCLSFRPFSKIEYLSAAFGTGFFFSKREFIIIIIIILNSSTKIRVRTRNRNWKFSQDCFSKSAM